MKPPKTFQCPFCGEVFTKHDEGYQHFLKCQKGKEGKDGEA